MQVLRAGFARFIAGVGVVISGIAAAHAGTTPDDLAAAYSQMVRQQRYLPVDEAKYYGTRALSMLEDARVALLEPQYLVVVDRDPKAQVILLYWLGLTAEPRLIGASPVSTGRVGQFDHFQTPTGVFDHSISGRDFRAEGTKNSLGIRGYGRKGMRIFDFGWRQAVRGWGEGGLSSMRLQMHATDPDFLESRLGSVQSKGCVRIPSTLNTFLDRFGILDADYEAAARVGQNMWVLSSERIPAPGAGRYLVILDSGRVSRPAWSPAPR